MVAFVFPGQGSQTVGMGKEFYASYEKAKEIFKKADEILNFPLSSYCFEGPVDKLAATSITQPAVLTTSIVCLSIFKSFLDIKPLLVMGHSLGEYTALVAAKAVSFEDSLRVVQKRAALMEEFSKKEYTMAAVLNIDKERLLNLCKKTKFKVELANFNTEKQIVVSGSKKGIEAIKVEVEKLGGRVIFLNVSGPFHSSFMKEASLKFEDILKDIVIKDAAIPIVSNVSAEIIKFKEDIYDSLEKHMCHPVLWQKSVLKALFIGVKIFIEFGPGKILSSLIKKIDKNVVTLSVYDNSSLKNTISYLKENLIVS